MKKIKTIRQEIDIEIIEGADVVVAGGGTAGVAAALAAARSGADTLLVEQSGVLGGMLTSGNAAMTMFAKYSGSAEEHAADARTLAENPATIQIAGGIAKEITDRLLKSGDGVGNHRIAGSYIFTSSEDFKRLLFQMTGESKVRLRLHSLVTDVIKENGVIKGVVTESKSGRQFIPAKQLVDATGDGDVAARAGVPFTVGVTEEDLCAKETKIGETTPVGVMFKVGNADLARTFDWLDKNRESFKRHPFSRFTFEEARRNFERGENAAMCVFFNDMKNWFQTYNLPSRGVVTICCPCVSGVDGCDTAELTRAEIVMADMVKRWVDRLREQIPGFENIFLMDCPEMGVRETRHIRCEHTLGFMDIYEQRSFDDCIGFGSHPIDTYPRPAWLNDPETAYPPRWFFQIPYRCLVAKGIKNLLIAGRCVSATHEAFGCIRPTVQCMITGEAAGTAAALCVKENCSPAALNITLLRETLRSHGVLL